MLEKTAEKLINQLYLSDSKHDLADPSASVTDPLLWLVMSIYVSYLAEGSLLELKVREGRIFKDLQTDLSPFWYD